jgi:hypothetical protein
MFSCWIVTNITSARGTVHCRKTRIPYGNQLVICGQYLAICSDVIVFENYVLLLAQNSKNRKDTKLAKRSRQCLIIQCCSFGR